MNINKLKTVLKKCVILFVLLTNYNIKSQTKNWYLIDSIKLNELSQFDKTLLDSILPLYHKEKNDTARINYISFLSENLQNGEMFSAYCDLIEKNTQILLEKKESTSKIIKFCYEKKILALSGKGYYYLIFLNQPSLALPYFYKALKLSKQINYTSSLASLYHNIGVAHSSSNQLDSCISWYEKSLEMAIKTDDKIVQGFVYSDIANVQTKFKDYTNAKINIQKSMQIRKLIHDTINIWHSYFSIGSLFYEQKKYDSAVYYNRISAKIALKDSLIIGVYYSYREIGNSLSQLNQLDSAEYYLQKAYTLALRSKDSSHASACAVAFAFNSLRQKKYTKVIQYLKPKYSWLLLKASNSQIENLYEVLIKTNIELGNKTEAQNYLNLLKNLLKNLIENDSKSKALKMQYDIDFKLKVLKEEETNKQREIELSYQKKTKETIFISAAIILFLTLSLLFILYNRYSTAKKQKLIIEQQNKALEIERLTVESQNKTIQATHTQLLKAIENQDELKNINTIFQLEQQLLRNQINPHFIFNSLNSIQNLVLSNNSINAYEYISKFGKLLRKTLNNSDEILTPLNEELDNLKVYIELEMLRMNNKFNYVIEVDPIINLIAIKIPILLIQPYVENSIWHGFSGLANNEEGMLILKIQQKAALLHIQIIDNGIGIEASRKLKEQIHQSKGLNINIKRLDSINYLMKNKKAEVIVTKNKPKGTIISITIPIITFIN